MSCKSWYLNTVFSTFTIFSLLLFYALRNKNAQRRTQTSASIIHFTSTQLRTAQHNTNQFNSTSIAEGRKKVARVLFRNRRSLVCVLLSAECAHKSSQKQHRNTTEKKTNKKLFNNFETHPNSEFLFHSIFACRYYSRGYSHDHKWFLLANMHTQAGRQQHRRSDRESEKNQTGKK